ncbi:MAG: putative lipid II flippase FtsW [Salinibacterium sp.]|nr:putative lipid II flippase FtsW [Salinibacterium sp.]
MTTTRGPQARTQVPPRPQSQAAQRAKAAQQALAAQARAARTPPMPTPPRAPRSRPAVAVVPVRRIFAAAQTNYFLLLGVTLFLVTFGLVMVLSSSTIESFNDNEGFFGRFARQGLFAVVGIPLMLLASRMPPQFWKRWAWPALVFGGALQMLVFVPGIGLGYGGNNNWIRVGSFTAQPSEFVKIALIVWVAWILTSKQDLLSDWKHVALPIAPVAGLAILLVLVGNDLGTASVMLIIVLGCIYFAGVRLRFLFTAVVGVAILAGLFALTSSSRTERISAWLNGCTAADYSGYCWQPEHANWALAAGGLFGKGLGNSVAKWNWLPEASSDYIFAIIGEELGLIGATVVLALFVVLTIAFVRIIRSTSDSFARTTTAGVMVWVIGQAMVNIAVVLGVLPVLGVPLPLISAGGSALIATLLGIGVVLSFARSAPQTPRTAAVAQTPAERSRMLAAQRVRSRG